MQKALCHNWPSRFVVFPGTEAEVIMADCQAPDERREVKQWLIATKSYLKTAKEVKRRKDIDWPKLNVAIILLERELNLLEYMGEKCRECQQMKLYDKFCALEKLNFRDTKRKIKRLEERLFIWISRF